MIRLLWNVVTALAALTRELFLWPYRRIRR